ncbi:MAG: SIS domain-containing protein [Deltaproteobacteria bacterium]|nr:SIS domain-containing protein [Deltaproteobacteria bacterium]
MMNDFEQFVDDYYKRFVNALEAFDKAPLAEICDVLERVRDVGGTVWVAGNGGSAAIADHTVCDTTKGTHVDGVPPLHSVSLSANGPMLTALANDLSYEDVFRQQLVYYLGPEDAVLLVSSSGNSPNVVAACKYAKERGVPTIAFVGFEGGELRRLADHSVWIAVDNYGIAEDTHQSLMHVLTQYLRIRAETAAP